MQLRLRQLVFASMEARDIETLQNVLGLGAPFVDSGVGEFGLTNGVFALGDQFLEVVVPVKPNTAAERFLQRSGGQGGYMAIFQTDNLSAVRDRADDMGLRRVWNIDLPDISASHLHPADIGAAIVSVDEARPPSSWRWGGPGWEERSAPGRITGLTVAARDPATLAARWSGVLGAPITSEPPQLELQDGKVRFETGNHDCLSAFHLAVREPAACLERAREAGLPIEDNAFTFCGVKVLLAPD